MDTNLFPTRHVVACIPYYNCARYIRRAVESLLAQTHTEITIVVMNDGDFTNPPWPKLADIQDPRLVRFNLKENRGPYFATQVVLSTTKAPYFLIQDADDWSHPHRVELLLNSLEREKSNFAVSAQPQLVESESGTHQLIELRWLRNKANASSRGHIHVREAFQVNKRLDADFLYRLPHHGLYRTKALQNVGGYHPAFRINYDCVVPNLMLMTGRVSHVAAPLYFRFRLKDSLTHSCRTGVLSTAAQKEKKLGSMIYSESYYSYRQFVNGQINDQSLSVSIRKSLLRVMNKEIQTSLFRETDRFVKQITKMS